MRWVTRATAAAVLCAMMTDVAFGAEQERTVDLAICLDTSGSMSGLINSARQKLWQIVNELATAKPTPRLRVALLTYGTPSYGRDSGFVRVDQDLTEDLDTVYEKLMALGTRGGKEYVARVVRRALDSLSWEANPEALRVIFVAGNESADQDPKLTNEDVCKTAATRDIIVNTIYCGNEDNADADGYRRVATLADGRFAAIDQNRGTVVINTPYDKELARLSNDLNRTYVAYGRKGGVAAARQVAQDTNAARMSPSAAADRAAAKSSKLYRNAGWDLVDAVAREGKKLEEIAEGDLPEEMQKMSEEERTAHVERMSKRRAEIQAQIKELALKRQQHIDEETKKRSVSEAPSFDAAARAAVRAQAEAKGFAF